MHSISCCFSCIQDTSPLILLHSASFKKKSSHQPFWWWVFFKVGSHGLFAQGQLHTSVLPISVSQVARITGVSHQCWVPPDLFISLYFSHQLTKVRTNKKICLLFFSFLNSQTSQRGFLQLFSTFSSPFTSVEPTLLGFCSHLSTHTALVKSPGPTLLLSLMVGSCSSYLAHKQHWQNQSYPYSRMSHLPVSSPTLLLTTPSVVFAGFFSLL
jgi:hypothetical protein